MYNIEELKQQLKDYYGTAMYNSFPMAVIELSRIENMSDEEILREARKIGLI